MAGADVPGACSVCMCGGGPGEHPDFWVWLSLLLLPVLLRVLHRVASWPLCLLRGGLARIPDDGSCALWAGVTLGACWPLCALAPGPSHALRSVPLPRPWFLARRRRPLGRGRRGPNAPPTQPPWTRQEDMETGPWTPGRPTVISVGPRQGARRGRQAAVSRGQPSPPEGTGEFLSVSVVTKLPRWLTWVLQLHSVSEAN